MLRFRPFLAFRDANSLCVANSAINRDIEAVPNGVATCLYEGFPKLYMQFSHKVTVGRRTQLVQGIEYVKDLERGVPYCEDLWVPGYFEVPIKKGRVADILGRRKRGKPAQPSKMYHETEMASRTPAHRSSTASKNSAKQFYIRRGESMYLISGFPGVSWPETHSWRFRAYSGNRPPRRLRNHNGHRSESAHPFRRHRSGER